MRTCKYLIVGGGMSAHAAILGVREVDAEGSIALVSEEPDPPYNRPPLSKALWKGKTVESIGSRVYPAALARFLMVYFREKGVGVLAGEAVTGVGRTGERASPTAICPLSIRTSSTSATRRWARWTPASRRSRTGRSPTARGSSIT